MTACMNCIPTVIISYHLEAAQKFDEKAPFFDGRER